jgi:hypothetical protein
MPTQALAPVTSALRGHEHPEMGMLPGMSQQDCLHSPGRSPDYHRPRPGQPCLCSGRPSNVSLAGNPE